jgi:glycosyltransferase involved in cell wall biosynthesis
MMSWLIPRLSVFHDQHPDIELRFNTNYDRIDFVRDGLGDHRFACAGRAIEKNAATRANAVFACELAMQERINHLQADFLLDVIEAGDPYRLAWAALDAARVSGAPTVLFCHSDVATLAVHAIERCSGIGPDTTHGLALRAGERIARYVARLGEAFDLVLAPSRALQRRLIDSGVRHVLYQPLGVDTATFHPRARDECWRAGLGIPAGARLLLYAGRFAPEKNMPQLEAAIQRLGAGGSKRATHPSDVLRICACVPVARDGALGN